MRKETDVKKEINRVLAEGELTGHAHVADVGEVTEVGGKKFFATKEPAKVTHQEHETVKVPPGEHRVERVLEYDHFAEEAKEVKD